MKNKSIKPKLKKLGRNHLCTLCRGNSAVMSKYKLFVCRHCFRENYNEMGWVKEK
jgi:ribosomal protein S14